MTGPGYGVRRVVSALASTVLAPNPGPMTLTGTQSYLLVAPGAAGVVVVDPGPDDPGHLDVLARQQVELILITHRHADHTSGAPELAARTGAPVRAMDPAYCSGGEPLHDGELLRAAGMRIAALATPGHTDDSVCFHLPDDRPAGPDTSGDGTTGRGRVSGAGSVLTGDTVLGRGSTVIAHPDGRLADYLESLDRLSALGPALVLPAHGPPLPNLAVACAQYTAHRMDRLRQIRAALARLGPQAGAAEVTDLVYSDLDPAVRFAAELSVAAQLAYLRG